jgi:cytochrome c peroxidase
VPTSAASASCRLPRLLLAVLCASGLVGSASAAAPAAISSAPTGFYATPFERRPNVKTMTELGRALFFDRALSASGKLACASCHDPAHAYGPPNARAVQLGGPALTLPGVRAVPSLKYRQVVPAFSEHFFDDDGNDSEDQGPTGGLDWDGRARSAHEQAAAPLLSPFEMANADAAAAIARLAESPNAPAFRDAFGPHVFDKPQFAWNGLVMALEVFQQSPTDFYPYDSKYDRFLRGELALTAAERRGLLAFNDAHRGNCAQCHPSALKRGAFPQFTDDGFIALGVPRNRAIPANAKPGWFDLGLCGPLRADLAAHPEYCGLFRTPSLRNVALRPVFFHNGVYARLEDAVRFYAQRDAAPGRIYPSRGGRVEKFDDLPERYRGNVNDEAPFESQKDGRPALTPAEIGDIVAFLKTLTDGYPAPKRADARPPAAERPSVPVPCRPGGN